MEVQLYLLVLGINAPVIIFQDWYEENINWNNRPFPDMQPEILPFSLFYNINGVKMTVIVEKYANVLDDISISIGYIEMGGYEDFIAGYSREHPNQDVVPKLIWTIIGASV